MRKASIKQNHEVFEERLGVLDSVAWQIVRRRIGNTLGFAPANLSPN